MYGLSGAGLSLVHTIRIANSGMTSGVSFHPLYANLFVVGDSTGAVHVRERGAGDAS